jgi:tetratricopeptide (TPR) repeat protein
MKAELDRAYALIKAGQTEEALAILEVIIQENPQSEDAWWLLANATNDNDAKRNALNNLISLTNNQQRRAQAQNLLEAIDADPYSFDRGNVGTANSQQWNNARPIQSNRNGCGRMVLIGIGALGLLACVACFAFTAFTLPYFTMPDDFEDMGSLEENQLIEGTVISEESDRYAIEGKAGDTIQITLRVEDNTRFPPFMFLFGPDGLVQAVNSEAAIEYVRLRQTLPANGDYVLIVRPLWGVGGGEYSIEMEILN